MQRARGDKYVWERAEGQAEVQVAPKGSLKQMEPNFSPGLSSFMVQMHSTFTDFYCNSHSVGHWAPRCLPGYFWESLGVSYVNPQMVLLDDSFVPL